MKLATLFGIAAVAIVTGVLAGVAAPAIAEPVGNTLTGVSITPAIVQSGEPVTITFTGTGSAPFRWFGAYNVVTTGPTGVVLFQTCWSNVSLSETIVDTDSNYQAEPITTTHKFFAGACVDLETPPVGESPTYEASFTDLPMVQTTDVAATEGVPLAPTNSASIHGQFHIDPWVPDGGFYQAVDSANCTLAIQNIAPTSIAPLTPIALPAGLTLNSTPTPSGVEPTLSVSGTPATGTAGTYKVCVELVESKPIDHAFGYLTIDIQAPTVPELAKTGIETGSSPLAALGAAAALALGGVALVLMRRRRVSRLG